MCEPNIQWHLLPSHRFHGLHLKTLFKYDINTVLIRYDSSLFNCKSEAQWLQCIRLMATTNLFPTSINWPIHLKMWMFYSRVKKLPAKVGVQTVTTVKYLEIVSCILKSQNRLKVWCIFAAEPFINKYCIENAASDSVFVIVDVGDRPT